MTVTVVENENGTMADYGDNVRVEKRFKAEDDGSHLWVLYKRDVVPTVDGKLIHPVHGNETTETHVWMPQNTGTEEAMRDAATALASSID